MQEVEAIQILEQHAIERNIHGYWVVPLWDGKTCHYRQFEDAVDAAEALKEEQP